MRLRLTYGPLETGAVRVRAVRVTGGCGWGGSEVVRGRGRDGYGHLAVTTDGPVRSYSARVIHWVAKGRRLDPPIQAEKVRSGGATTLIFGTAGARLVSSWSSLSSRWSNMVDPPASTMLP